MNGRNSYIYIKKVTGLSLHWELSIPFLRLHREYLEILSKCKMWVYSLFCKEHSQKVILKHGVFFWSIYFGYIRTSFNKRRWKMKGNLSIINFLQLRGGNATNVRGPKVMVRRMTSAEASTPPPPPLTVLATIVSQPMGIWTGPRPRYTSAILPTSNGLKTVKLNEKQKIFYVLIIFSESATQTFCSVNGNGCHKLGDQNTPHGIVKDFEMCCCNTDLWEI